MQIAQALFLVLSAALFVLWLAVALVGRLPPGGDKVLTELRYGARVRSAALFAALAMPLLTLAILALLPWHNLAQLTKAGLILLALCLPGGLLLLEVQRVRLAISETGLIADSPWRGRRAMRWDEVEHVSCSALNRWLVIEGRDKTTIRASFFLTGLPALLTALRDRVPAAKRAGVRRHLDQA